MEFWTKLFATANGGRINGNEQNEPQTDTQVCSETPGTRANVSQDKIITAVGSIISSIPGLKEYINSLQERKRDSGIIRPND
jgi:hypothetical protein